METKKTLVIGASEKLERYSNKAVRMLQEHNVPVVAFGKRKGNINGTPVIVDFPTDKDFHSVTMYMSAKNQIPFYNKIISLKPKRVIFNPGTENTEFESLLAENKIDTEVACTLVLLRTNAF